MLAYTGDPVKRRLDFILAAWQRARRGGETLVVAGIERPRDPAAGVRSPAGCAPDEYRALLRRARVFVAAPRREDFGIAPLEALADGCMLVTTPSPGPYPALGLARRLDPRLVSEDLAPALRAALDDPCAELRGARRGAAGAVQPRRASGRRWPSACCLDCCQDGGDVIALAFIPSPSSNGFSIGPLFFHAYGIAYVFAVAAAILISRWGWRAQGGDPDLPTRWRCGRSPPG